MSATSARRGRGRTARRLVAALASLAALTLAAAAPAQAEFGVESFSTTLHQPAPYLEDWFNAVSNGDPAPPPPPLTDATQAGAHPDLTTFFSLDRTVTREGTEIAASMKDLELDLPVGFYGNPQVTPQCARGGLYDQVPYNYGCPPDTQVGIAWVFGSGTANGPYDGWTAIPVFNVVPLRDEAAAFVFKVFNSMTEIRVSVRGANDYGIRATVRSATGFADIGGVMLTLWGVPADPVHTFERLDATGMPGAVSTLPRRPFLTAPATCDGEFVSTLRVNSWYDPERWATASHTMPQSTGCDALRFEAGMELRPQHARPDEPAGFDIDLNVRQSDDPDGLSTPTVRKVQTTLPAGVAISPPSAWGLDGCTDAQTKLGTAEDAACPETSKIGTVSIETPLLAQPLVGDVFLRSPQPGNLFRLLIVARGSGIVIKLPGTVSPDHQTGQITAVFDNTPQLPFSRLRMSLRGGDRAPLVNAPTCGPKTTSTEITSHTGAVASSTSTFNIEGCGADVFSPSFSAGVQNAVAGKSGAFSLTLRRAGGPQVLRTLKVAMPNGLLARVGDVPLCDDSAAATGACGEQSRVGSVTVGAGAGASPFHLGGRVYMGGPYKGAPYSLSIVVPAIAGPFDLGTVVVRAAIQLDRTDASLTVTSDPMPTILEGVPLNLRTLNVAMDRTQFMVNPTNCSPAAVDGVIGSQTGTEVARSARFQVADCAALPYKPKLELTAGNARRAPRNGQTMPLTATLKMTPGQANNRVVQVDLPRTVNARLEVISNDKACTFEQFTADRCPQEIGTATASTPLLKEQLSGPIYLVRNPARRLPDMVVRLRGQGTSSLVAVDVTGKITINRNLTLRTAFDTIPDVPITSFSLSLVAGKRGAVGAIGNFCTAKVRKASVARLSFQGQNGKRLGVAQPMKVAGCRPAKARGRSAKRATKKGGSARAAR